MRPPKTSHFQAVRAFPETHQNTAHSLLSIRKGVAIATTKIVEYFCIKMAVSSYCHHLSLPFFSTTATRGVEIKFHFHPGLDPILITPNLRGKKKKSLDSDSKEAAPHRIRT